MNEENKPSAWIPILIFISLMFWAFFFALIWYTNGLRIDNIKKNKEVCELRCYKQAWIDFNKSYIPETALPRIKEIEAIYNER